MNETANPRRLVSWLSLRCMRQIGQDPSGQRGQSFALPAVFVVAHFFLSFTFSLWGCPMKWSAVDRCCRGWQAKPSVQVYVPLCACSHAYSGHCFGACQPCAAEHGRNKATGTRSQWHLSLSFAVCLSVTCFYFSCPLQNFAMQVWKVEKCNVFLVTERTIRVWILWCNPRQWGILVSWCEDWANSLVGGPDTHDTENSRGSADMCREP